MIEFRITPPVSFDFPNLFVNLIVVRGLSNQPTDTTHHRILEYSRSCQRMLRREFPSKEALTQDPRIQAYFDMFRTFGSNPKRLRPSHFALADRVVRGGDLPNINPAVNLYNALSVRYLVPFGGEDLSAVDSYFELAYATGEEPWTPIGATRPECVRPGDVVWRDRVEVSTTSLNYRQCDKTKLTATTRDVHFLSEGFMGVNDKHIDHMSEAFIEVFKDFLGGTYERYFISSSAPVTQVAMTR